MFHKSHRMDRETYKTGDWGGIWAIWISGGFKYFHCLFETLKKARG